MLTVEIMPGQTLWQALTECGYEIERPCGGKGLCEGCRVYVEGIGRVRSCQFAEPGSYRVELLEQMQFEAVGAASDRGNILAEPAAAVDIGTTTIVMKLFYKGKVYETGFVNPQRVFGADVMSRIQAANDGALWKLQALLREKLYQELEILMKRCGADIAESWQVNMVISANTTMQHIYRGFSCEGLGRAPFSPVTLELERANGSNDHVQEIFLPGISAYVGADIVSGIYALELLEEEKPVLLLDLGTNGEMALGCKKKLLVASTAAGPAFEGSELAMNIHASGIMRILHELIRERKIDKNGTLVDPYFEHGYPVQKQDLRITQEDIREIQMAKGAIRAGIEMLLGAYGIAPQEVEKVYLAGGMGYYLEPEDAAAIGLLPYEFLQKKKIQSVGNTSLRGAVRFLQEEEAQAAKQLQRIKEMAKEITLANTARFQKLYMKYMNFEEEP